MKKKTVLATLAALTIGASTFAGCGNNGNTADAIPTGNMTAGDISANENNESLKGDATEKEQTDSQQKAAETQAEPTDTKTTETTNTTAPAKPAEDKAASTGNSKPGNSGEAKSDNTSSKPTSSNSGSSNTSGNSNSKPANTQASQPSAPAHEHVWHEHTVTTQQWVPDVVVVDDYETKSVEVGSIIQCNCGATFSDSASLDEHSMNHILAGEPDNWQSVPVYEQQQVKVGSHEEDHGHYETVTTVDYYYCDCGATK